MITWKQDGKIVQKHGKVLTKLVGIPLPPTVVMEAVSDYHFWFCHTSFGYVGSSNNLNILNLSPFLDCLLDGSFTKTEKEVTRVPLQIGDDLFTKLFVMADGMYPHFSRFIKGLNS
jgi:Plant transposon protein